MHATSNASDPPGAGFSARYRPGFLISGIVMMLCGVLAIFAPFLSTFAVTLTVGVAGVVAGIAQIVQGFRSARWKGLFLYLLIGLLYVAAGALFFLSPITGALAITAILSWLLLFSGASEVALGFRMRPSRGWIWLILSGLIACAGAFWLMLRLPLSSFFVPGIALGLALLFEGAAFVAIASGDGDARRASADAVPDDDEAVGGLPPKSGNDRD